MLVKTTPEVLRTAYGIDKITKASSKNSMAVVEFHFPYYDTTDLNAFNSACGENVGVAQTHGGNNGALYCTLFPSFCYESHLDIEYIKAITGPIPLTDIFFGKYSILN